MKKIMVFLFALFLLVFASSLCFASRESEVPTISANIKEMSSQTPESRKIPWGILFIVVELVLLVIAGALIEAGSDVGWIILIGTTIVLGIGYVIYKIVDFIEFTQDVAGCLKP